MPGLLDLVQAHLPGDHTLGAELVLEGLHRSSLLAKEPWRCGRCSRRADVG